MRRDGDAEDSLKFHCMAIESGGNNIDRQQERIKTIDKKKRVEKQTLFSNVLMIFKSLLRAVKCRRSEGKTIERVGRFIGDRKHGKYQGN